MLLLTRATGSVDDSFFRKAGMCLLSYSRRIYTTCLRLLPAFEAFRWRSRHPRRRKNFADQKSFVGSARVSKTADAFISSVTKRSSGEITYVFRPSRKPCSQVVLCRHPQTLTSPLPLPNPHKMSTPLTPPALPSHPPTPHSMLL